jgi:hypothetical protein
MTEHIFRRTAHDTGHMEEIDFLILESCVESRVPLLILTLT